MNVLELFAGAGGGILGSKLLGSRTICAVEVDPYCREILLRRQEEGYLEPFPVWDDIRTFNGEPWRGLVDVVAAGFPCQPWSDAGKRLGEQDDRNLWPDTIRIIREMGPKFAFLENVPGLASKDYFWEQILPDLAEAGYDSRWEIVSAAECGAPHLRKRLWILGYANSQIKSTQPIYDEASWLSGNASNSQRSELWFKSRRCCGSKGKSETEPHDNGEEGKQRRQDTSKHGWWETEPDVGRVVDGLAHRVDRLKAIGNGQVPAVVKEAWLRLIRHEGCE